MTDKKSLKKVIFIAAAFLLLAALYFFVDARYSHFFPTCIFHSLTGLYCPGCGSQRAFSSLLHGKLLQAINYNVLMVLCLPLIFYSSLVTVINVFRREKLAQRMFYSTSFVKILFVVIIAFWVVRNLPYYPFNLLAPHQINQGVI